MENSSWLALIIVGLIIALVTLMMFVRSKQRWEQPVESDSDFYDLDNRSAYQNGVCRQVQADFRPRIEELYRSIDEMYAKAKIYNHSIDQAMQDEMAQILRRADTLEQHIDRYWHSKQYEKNFLYYIGLHYASHLLGCAIKAEQQKIKDTFVECKNKQEAWSKAIEAAQRRQERLHGEEKRRLSAEIGEMCKTHKYISTLKGQIGAINTQYNNRVTQQNIETGKRRDYIGMHFGERGKRWRAKIMAKHH